MWPDPVERVTSYLRAAAAEARVEEFPEGTPTAEAAARAAGVDASQIVKTLVLVADGAYVVALVPGDARADEAKVAQALGATDLRVARAREVEDATGFAPGAVAPFPHRAVSRVVMERTLLANRVVWVGAGSSTHMAGVSPADLQRLTHARTFDLVAAG